MDQTKTDAYYSTLDAIITIIDRKMPADAQDPETLERMLDEVLMHYKLKAF